MRCAKLARGRSLSICNCGRCLVMLVLFKHYERRIGFFNVKVIPVVLHITDLVTNLRYGP